MSFKDFCIFSPTAIALGFQSLKGGCAGAFGPKRPQCQRGIPIGIPIAIPMGIPMASYSFLLLGGILEPIYYYTTISADFWNPFITTQRYRHRFSISFSERGFYFDFGIQVRCIFL